LSVPILAIGGITAENLAVPFDAGADGVALVSAVYGSHNPGEAARRILENICSVKA
jgi:thiamine-phosphate pyrophosphorylase